MELLSVFQGWCLSFPCVLSNVEPVTMQTNKDIRCTLLLFEPRTCTPSPHLNGIKLLIHPSKFHSNTSLSSSPCTMPVDPFFIDWSGPDVEMAYASPVVVPEKGAKKSRHIAIRASKHNPSGASGMKLAKWVVTEEIDGYWDPVMITAVSRMTVSSTMTFGLGGQTYAHYPPEPTRSKTAIRFILSLTP